MEGDQLDAHEIVAGRDAARHVEVVPSAVLDHGVDGPHPAAEAALSNLEPAETGSPCGGGIVNLGKIDHDWALVAPRDRVVGVVGRLRTADDMAPPRADPRTGRDGDYGVVLELDASVARKVRVVDVHQRVVAGRRADALQLALVLSIH